MEPLFAVRLVLMASMPTQLLCFAFSALHSAQLVKLRQQIVLVVDILPQVWFFIFKIIDVFLTALLATIKTLQQIIVLLVILHV